MTRDEWLEPEDDERPVIGRCAVCGCDIHGESLGYYADDWYCINGDDVCEECVWEYLKAHCRGVE